MVGLLEFRIKASRLGGLEFTNSCRCKPEAYTSPKSYG